MESVDSTTPTVSCSQNKESQVQADLQTSEGEKCQPVLVGGLPDELKSKIPAKFEALPYEVKLQIWKETIMSPRVLYLSVSCAEPHVNGILGDRRALLTEPFFGGFKDRYRKYFPRDNDLKSYVHPRPFPFEDSDNYFLTQPAVDPSNWKPHFVDIMTTVWKDAKEDIDQLSRSVDLGFLELPLFRRAPDGDESQYVDSRGRSNQTWQRSVDNAGNVVSTFMNPKKDLLVLQLGKYIRDNDVVLSGYLPLIRRAYPGLSELKNFAFEFFPWEHAIECVLCKTNQNKLNWSDTLWSRFSRRSPLPPHHECRTPDETWNAAVHDATHDPFRSETIMGTEWVLQFSCFGSVANTFLIDYSIRLKVDRHPPQNAKSFQGHGYNFIEVEFDGNDNDSCWEYTERGHRAMPEVFEFAHALERSFSKLRPINEGLPIQAGRDGPSLTKFKVLACVKTEGTSRNSTSNSNTSASTSTSTNSSSSSSSTSSGSF